ncbi:hypothetical protein S40285_03195 [Stachybotrys chlorohalonatus IBT 40285]|uniref:DUF2828 domain-containing protein n=1 Tax=Stachybotrys chlorohalonatus (strain IBT 40285) TaxID=1283841 RepID=A0A084QI33_STAC4|nr:hypothetical protein S40285_03195 [Stachybotrys chlorohalonata IBT 40285]
MEGNIAIQTASEDQQAWFLRSSYPVELPVCDALTAPRQQFESFVVDKLAHGDSQGTPTLQTQTDNSMDDEDAFATEEAFTLVSESTSTDIRKGLDVMELQSLDDYDPDVSKTAKDATTAPAEEPKQPFMKGLLDYSALVTPQQPTQNRMLTDNGDLAYRSTNNALVDLFSYMSGAVSGPLLLESLAQSWAVDPLATLKIIFNSRSIHLGQGSKMVFYRCAGWLYKNHPQTLVANLKWLSRPVIQKKVTKTNAEGDDVVLVEAADVVDNKEEDEMTKHDVKHGVAHGYWKDLLNLLVLAVNNKLDVLQNPRDVLNSENRGFSRGERIKGKKGRGRGRGRAVGRGRERGGHASFTLGTQEIHMSTPTTFFGDDKLEDSQGKPPVLTQKERKRQLRQSRHSIAVRSFNDAPAYQALHLTVARLFAEQLRDDLAALRGSDRKAKRTISLCGKWAPSHDHLHDRHTLIISSIAEILHPRETIGEGLSPSDDRETYLRYARERYRKDVSALRKHLEVVERDITAETFSNIKYDRIASVAMKMHFPTFIEKDTDRFEEYIENVAKGTAKISGATLLPSALIKSAASVAGYANSMTVDRMKSLSMDELVREKAERITTMVIDGQWKALVQRIKDSGTLSSSIAVCDVSGSMYGPQFPDGTAPIHSAIGLSLLVAEVTTAPFGGTFITFSHCPEVLEIDMAKPLSEKVTQMQKASWAMSTNMLSVFEDLILPMATENKLKQEDMVKRVFVFSDMHFDQANRGHGENTWCSTFDAVKAQYAEAGYEMPELVFWNLAGAREQRVVGAGGDLMAPKPVTADEKGTCLVSGYSPGMLKVFMENGTFDEEDGDEADLVMKDDEEGDHVLVEQAGIKAKKDPLATVMETIGHKAYAMLQVVD